MRIFWGLVMACFTGMANAAPPMVQVRPGAELQWSTVTGRMYQAQRMVSGAWVNVGAVESGDGAAHSAAVAEGAAAAEYRVLETIPGQPVYAEALANGGFELGAGGTSTGWSMTGGIHTRTTEDASAGIYSHRAFIQNVGSIPGSGLLVQQAAVTPGAAWTFRFRAKQIATSPTYVQFYDVQWLDAGNAVLAATGNRAFTGGSGQWSEVTSGTLTAPASAVGVKIVFYFATGSVTGATGGVLLDELSLRTQTGTTAAQTTSVAVQENAVAVMSWPTESGALYGPRVSSDLINWTPLSDVIGDGGTMAAVFQAAQGRGFFRLVHPSDLTPDPAAVITPLFDASTANEPAVLEETATALITRLADRARDRHAREDLVNGVPFRKYDHYLPFYWEQRIAEIEIEDRVAKGGSGVTFQFITHARLNPAEFRTFYGNTASVALYHNNMSDLAGQGVTLVSTTPSTRHPGETEYRYTATITSKQPEGRALQIGDRMEVELSQFLLTPRNGRANYYGTAFLYVVGQGVLPWYAKMKEEAADAAAREAASFDSYPLPQSAWLGGRTTLPYQYSNEPQHRLKQMAGNISTLSGHEFMLGRRIHHTDFQTGAHSEAGNPLFTTHAGKLGPKFIATSCVSCHINNGRSLPPAIGAAIIEHAVVKTGRDAHGAPHPQLGEQLQPQTVSGTPEASITLTGYETITGSYGDGTAYSLRRPQHAFIGITPTFFSVRSAPPLVGLGLLEAVDEATITALADPDDTNADGISGRVSLVRDPEDAAKHRIGRFSHKAAQPRVMHQIAAALNRDMGVTTALMPVLDGETLTRPAEFSAAELDHLTRYVSLLGVSARRDLTDAAALQGEGLFESIGCAQCHTPSMTTGAHHPLAELRQQIIHPFTDLLLHDLGPGLADNMGEKSATGAEWRTAPLWNIGLTSGVSGGEAYLHDGRARTLEEAILWHAGEAEAAKEAFRTLPPSSRDALVKFLRSL